MIMWQYQIIKNRCNLSTDKRRGDRENMWENNSQKIYKFGKNINPHIQKLNKTQIVSSFKIHTKELSG